VEFSSISNQSIFSPHSLVGHPSQMRVGCTLRQKNFRGDIFTLCPPKNIRYDSVYLTCNRRLTGSQLVLPHGINKKLKCETKSKMMSVVGPVQSRYRDKLKNCPFTTSVVVHILLRLYEAIDRCFIFPPHLFHPPWELSRQKYQ